MTNNQIPQSLLLITLFFAFFSCEKKPADQSIEVEVSETAPRHVRVLWTEQPSSHAIVSWTTLYSKGEKHRIVYDTVSRKDNSVSYSFEVNSKRNGEITMMDMDDEEGVPPGFFHHGEIKNLKPSSRYYFRVESDGQFSEEYYFVTAPSDDRQISILWGGDSRLGGQKPIYAGRTPHVGRQNMNKRIKALIDENDEILAFTHGADYGSTAEWRHLFWWFEDHEIVVGKDNRLLPLIISRGNHDYAIGFQENFWLSTITDEQNFGYYYTTQLTPQVTLITLNTEISVAGNQRVWLEKELEENRPTKRWLITHFHRPAYPVVKDFDAHTFKRVREAWVPLFEKYNIDLACESDGHILKRTLPIRNGKPDESGIVYIGEGGLGVPQRTADTSRWFIQPPGFAKSADNVHWIQFRADSLVVRAIGPEGNVLDYYSRAPRIK